jgi:Protein of unknown function (DUF4242)
MPRFLDIQSDAAGATPESLAEAHAKDLAIQHKYGVRYLRYYYDAATGRVFCLSDAPDHEAALAVHREAHGRMPDEIFEVQEFE